MWRAVVFLSVVLAIAAAGAFLADNPGNFSVIWFGWRVETSFTLVAIILIAVLGAALWSWRFILKTFGSPAALLTWNKTRRLNKGQEALRQGLVAVAAGNPAEVRKLAREANRLLDDPPLTLLLSAQAAQLEGDDKRAHKAFKAMLDNPETEFLGLRGLFMQAARSGNRLEALGHAERAFELQPETPWVFNALFELQTAIGEWSSAAETLERSVSSKHMDAATAKRRRAVLFAEHALAATDEREAEEWGVKAAELSPGLVPAAILAAGHQIAEGKLWKAAEIIEAAWTANPHPDLASAYRAARKGYDPQAEPDIKAEARWLKGLADFNRDHIESRLLRAEQDLALGRLKAARKGLGALVENYPTARVCKLMADIEAADGNADVSRDWLTKTVTAPRDAHWMCETCGRESRAWTSTCANCGAFDTLAFKAPTDLVLEPLTADESGDDEPDAPADLIDITPEPPAGELVVIEAAAEDVSGVNETSETEGQDGKSAPRVNERIGKSNPLARERIVTDIPQGTEGDAPLVAPTVDDPGPDAEDPFDESGERRW